MSIKSQGGVFGRNPTFNDVEVEGDLSIAGTLTIAGETLSGLDFEGAWDASSGVPSASPIKGQFWIVSVAGSTNLDGITNWGIGDWALYDGTAWQRIEGGEDGNFKALTSSSTTTLNGTTIPASKTLLVSTDIGSSVQGYDAGLNSIAGLPTIADKMLYTTGTDTWATTSITSAGRAILDDADASAQRTTLGLGTAATTASTDYATAAQGSTADSALQPGDIGSTVQGYDADTAKYDDTTANFTGTLQEGGNNVVTANEVGTIASQDSTSVNIDGGAIDGVTLGTNSAITEAQIDSINIDGDFIKTDTGNINIANLDTAYSTYVGGVQIKRIVFAVASGSTVTLTISGLQYGSASVHIGGYAAGGQGYCHRVLEMGGYMTSTSLYNVTTVASATGGGIAFGAVTKNSSSVTFTIVSTTASQTCQIRGWIQHYGVGTMNWTTT